MEEIERLLGFYFVSLVNEGKRYVRLKALAMALEAAKVGGRIARRVFLIFFASMLAVGGLFALISELLNQFSFIGEIYFSPVIGLSLIMLSGGSFYVYRSLQERAWLDVLPVNEILAKDRKPKVSPEPGVSREELRRLVDEAVSARFQEVRPPVKRAESA